MSNAAIGTTANATEVWSACRWKQYRWIEVVPTNVGTQDQEGSLTRPPSEDECEETKRVDVRCCSAREPNSEPAIQLKEDRGLVEIIRNVYTRPDLLRGFSAH